MERSPTRGSARDDPDGDRRNDRGDLQIRAEALAARERHEHPEQREDEQAKGDDLDAPIVFGLAGDGLLAHAG
jgi:hypothetical protein